MVMASSSLHDDNNGNGNGHLPGTVWYRVLIVCMMIMVIFGPSPPFVGTSSVHSNGNGHGNGMMLVMGQSSTSSSGNHVPPPVAARSSARIMVADMGNYLPSQHHNHRRDRNLRPLSSVGEARDSISMAVLLRCGLACQHSPVLLPFLKKTPHFVDADWAKLEATHLDGHGNGIPKEIVDRIPVAFLINGTTSTQVMVQSLPNNTYLVLAKAGTLSPIPLMKVVGTRANWAAATYSINPLLISTETTGKNNQVKLMTNPNDPGGIAASYRCLGLVQDSYWNNNTEGGSSTRYVGICKVSRPTDESCLHPYYADITPAPFSTNPDTPPLPTSASPPVSASTPTSSSSPASASAASASTSSTSKPSQPSSSSSSTAPPAQPTPSSSSSSSSSSTPPSSTTNTIVGVDFIATGGSNVANTNTNSNNNKDNDIDNDSDDIIIDIDDISDGDDDSDTLEIITEINDTLRVAASTLVNNVLGQPPTPPKHEGISILATVSAQTGVETLNVDWAMSSYPTVQTSNTIVGASVSIKIPVTQVTTVSGISPPPFVAACYGGSPGQLTMTANVQDGQPPPVITPVQPSSRAHQSFQIQLPAPRHTGSSTIHLICTDGSPSTFDIGERNYNIHRHDHFKPAQPDVNHRHRDYDEHHHHHGHDGHGHGYGHRPDGGYRDGEIREADREDRQRANDYSTNDIIPYHSNRALGSFTYSVAPSVGITSPLANVSTVQGSVPCPLTIACSGGYYPYTLTGIATRVSGEQSSFIPGLFSPVTNGAATGPLFTITLPAPGPGVTRIELQCTDSQGFSQKSNPFLYTIYAPVMISSLSSITTVVGTVPKPFHVHCLGGRRGHYVLSGSASSRDSSRGPISTEAVIASIQPLLGKHNQFLVSLPSAPFKGHSEITLECMDSGGATASTFFDFTVHDWVSITNVANIEAVIGSKPDDFTVECFGGFPPYALQASSNPIGGVSQADIHPNGPHSFTVSLPPPSSTTPVTIFFMCGDSLGNQATTQVQYMIAPQVTLTLPTSTDMLAEAVVGHQPASFEVHCQGGFAPYQLKAHSGGERPISTHELQRSIRRITTNPLEQPSVWIFTLPIPRVSGTTGITLRCEDSAAHVDSKTFTYSVAGELSMTISVESLIAVVGTAPKLFHLECKGGYWPYTVTGSASRDLSAHFSLELNRAISGSGPTFTVQLPVPTQRGQSTISFTCADNAGYPVEASMIYTVYEQVSITPIVDQRAVVGTLSPPFSVTCGGGVPPYTLVRQYSDGSSHLQLKITGQSPTFMVHPEHQGSPGGETALFAVQCIDSHKYSSAEQFSYTVAPPLTISRVESIHTVVNAPPRSFNVYCHGGFGPYGLSVREQQTPRGTGIPRISWTGPDGNKFVVTIASAVTVVHALLQVTCSEATGVQAVQQFSYTSHNAVVVETVDNILAVVGTRPNEVNIRCVGGFGPYTIDATTAARQPVSGEQVRQSLHDGWLRLPTPSYTGDAYISIKCTDSIGTKADFVITYSVKATVAVSSLPGVVQSIAGSPPTPFPVTCTGGFAPYTLIPIRRVLGGNPEPDFEYNPHGHHHHHHHDDNHDHTHTHHMHHRRQHPNELWVSGASPDFLITLPAVDESQVWDIELRCYDSIESRGVASFRYDIHDVVHVAEVSPSVVKTVVDTRPKPIEVRCTGGFHPYQVFVTSSVAGIVPDVHSVSRHDHTFKVFLPNPTAKDRVELVISCVDQYSNTDKAIVHYEIFDAVVVDYINDVRTVADREPQPVEITCHGGTGQPLSLSVRPGDSHHSTDSKQLIDDIKRAKLVPISGSDRNHIYRWSLSIPRPRDDVVPAGRYAASVHVNVFCTERTDAKPSEPFDFGLQNVQFTYYVLARVNASLRPYSMATPKANTYRLHTRVNFEPREFRITCFGGLGTAGYTLNGVISGTQFYRRILPSYSLQSWITEIKERVAEPTGRYTSGATRVNEHHHGTGDVGRMEHNIRDIEELNNEYRERVDEQQRVADGRQQSSTTFAIAFPTPAEYGTLELEFTCRDVASDETNNHDKLRVIYQVYGPITVSDIDEVHAIAGHTPEPIMVTCESPDQSQASFTARWSLNCHSSNPRVLSTTQFNRACKDAMELANHHHHKDKETGVFKIHLPKPTHEERSTLTITCLEEQLGSGSSSFEYFVHAPLQIYTDVPTSPSEISVVDHDNAPPITITCEGGYHPLELYTTLQHPSMFPFLPKFKPDQRNEYFNTIGRRTSPTDRVQRWEIDLKQVSSTKSHVQTTVTFGCKSPHVHGYEELTVLIKVLPPVEIRLDTRYGAHGSTRVNADLGARYYYRFTVWCRGGSTTNAQYHVRGYIEDGSGIGVADKQVEGELDRDYKGAADRERGVAFSVPMPKAKHPGDAHVILKCRDIMSGMESEELDVLYTIQRRHSSHHAHNNDQRVGVDASPIPRPIDTPEATPIRATATPTPPPPSAAPSSSSSSSSPSSTTKPSSSSSNVGSGRSSQPSSSSAPSSSTSSPSNQPSS